jgi:hypothetical protein
MSKTKLYELTDEHRAQLAPWRDKWIANAMSTAPMSEAEKAAAREAVKGLYRAANLEPPPDHRIVFVPSPFVMRFVGGFAAALWHLRDRAATRAATEGATDAATDAATSAATKAATWAATDAATSAATKDATKDATWAATDAATWAATEGATSAATRAATRAATEGATDAATDAATWAATEGATDAATKAATWAATDAATKAATWAATEGATSAATWAATEDATWAATKAATSAATSAATWAATEDATSAATEDATKAATRDATEDAWYPDLRRSMQRLAATLGGRAAPLLLSCAAHASRMWNGGNQWSGYSAYLSFFRHIARLPIDYSGWQHYETLALVSGPRILHAKFAIISDRPERLTVDAQNRPHCDDGPFCRWGDGTALYSSHGVRVPRYVAERPELITVARIEAETNAEVRRVMIDRFGTARFIRESGAKPVHADATGTLYERNFADGTRALVCHVVNSTPEADGSAREFWLRVHHELRPLLGNGQLGEPQRLTARNAVASTFGLRGDEYAPLAET